MTIKRVFDQNNDRHEIRSPREILESSSSFRPSLEKEKIVVERMLFVTKMFAGGLILLTIPYDEVTKWDGKRVRVTIEEIE